MWETMKVMIWFSIAFGALTGLVSALIIKAYNQIPYYSGAFVIFMAIFVIMFIRDGKND